MIKFLRTTNLTYKCKLIHSFLFNMMMLRLGPKNYVSGKDRFNIYKVMVGEKVNLPKVILIY